MGKTIKTKIEIKDNKLTTVNIKLPKFLKIKLLLICKRTGLTQTEVLKEFIENCEIEETIKEENKND